MFHNVVGVYKLIGIIQKHILHRYCIMHTHMWIQGLQHVIAMLEVIHTLLNLFFRDEMWDFSHASQFVQYFLLVLHLNGKFRKSVYPP
jgi:hypothetical protein